MDRLLRGAAALFGSRKSNKGSVKKRVDEKRESALNFESSSQNDIDETQNEKEEKLKNKGKLFVGGLNYRTTSRELEAYFSRFGNVIDSVVIRCPKTKKSRGFGFVTFINPDDAAKTLQTKDHVLDGRRIDCRLFGSKEDSKETKPKRSKEARVFLGGLPYSITKEELKQFFSRYGEVTNVYIPNDKDTKKAKGFAFLSFKDEDVMEKCVAERFIYLKERRVFINRADPRDARLRGEDAISGYDDSTTNDQESFFLEDSASLPDEDTQSSASGQLELEFEQYPEFHQVLEDYFKEKLAHYTEMSGKEIENRKDQVRSSDIERLENFFRGTLVNSHGAVGEVSDSESTNTDTKDGSDEHDTEDQVSLLLPQGKFAESVSKYSVGKNTIKEGRKCEVPFEKEIPGLKVLAQEYTADKLDKSTSPMKFTSSTGALTCTLCKWTPPYLSCESFLAHCKTAPHKAKLRERFLESQIEEGKSESKLCVNSERPKVALSEVRFYSKLTDIQSEDSQKQNKDGKVQKCGKMQQTHKCLDQQPPEQPLLQELVEQLQKMKEVPKSKKRSKIERKEQQQEQKLLNPVQESKMESASKTKNEDQKSQSHLQNSHQTTETQKMNGTNLKIYALAKGMACIQPVSKNTLRCEMCNKVIPASSGFDVLMRNVSQHLQSKGHLKKLLETEDQLKSLVSKNPEPAQINVLENRNSIEENIEGKKISAKTVKIPQKNPKNPKKQSKASLLEKAVPVPKENDPKGKDVKPQNATPEQGMGKTGVKKSEKTGGVNLLCLQCKSYNSSFEEFRRHLKLVFHTSTTDELLKASIPDCVECNSCKAFLFGSLYEINMHFSECLKEKS